MCFLYPVTIKIQIILDKNDLMNDTNYLFLGFGVICKTCNKNFTTKATLLKHRIWHHKTEFSEFKYSCEKCPYASSNLTSFKRHSNVHDESRPYACSQCSNRFTALNSLNHHYLIHTGEQLPLYPFPQL